MVAAVIKKNIERIEEREKQIFWAAFAVGVSLVAFYGVLMNRTIQNAIAEENMQNAIASLTAEVNGLEFKYLSMKDAITLDLAYQKGFVAAKNDNFASLAAAPSVALAQNR